MSNKNIIGVNKCTGNTVADITDGGTDTIFVAKIQTLTYAGNGSTSYHIDTNIHPIYVRIVQRETVDTTDVTVFETWDKIIDDNVAGGCIRAMQDMQKFRTDNIISIEADGFTVDDAGVDSHPNMNGVVYNVFVLGY